MSEPNPHQSDLVLGGQNPPPTNAAILGGLTGVKQRLESESLAERLSALNNAVQYGENAIDLVSQSLTDESPEVQSLASKLLRYRFGIAGEEALFRCALDLESHYDPFNKQQKIYNDKIEIVNPEDITYIIEIKSSNEQGWLLSNSDYLIKDVSLKKLRSMIIQLEPSSYLFYQSHLIIGIIDIVLKKNICSNLKSLGIDFRVPNECSLNSNVKAEIACDLHNLILDSTIAQKNLKFFKVQVLGHGSSQYITTRIESELHKLRWSKSSFNIISNMRVSFDG